MINVIFRFGSKWENMGEKGRKINAFFSIWENMGEKRRIWEKKRYINTSIRKT